MVMRKYLWMLALTMVLGLTSCAERDNEVLPGVNPTNDSEEEVMPTEDQMETTVTADIMTYVYSPFEQGSTGEALVKRLPNVTGNLDPDTRFILLKGSDFEDENSDLLSSEMTEIAHMYLDGAYVAVERPTRKQAVNFNISLLVGVITVIQQQLQQNFNMSETEAAAAARRTNAVARIRTRSENMARLTAAEGGQTRAAEVDMNEVVAEMMIHGTNASFMQQPLLDTYSRTPYLSGQMADAAARWLNDAVKEQEAEAEARSLTRAGESGSSAINEIMSASEEFTFSGTINRRTRYNYLWPYLNHIDMKVLSWGVHDLSMNKDYYYMKQMTTLKMKSLYLKANNTNDWWTAENYGVYDWYYGSFLSKYVTSMNLSGNGGTIKIEASEPSTDNNNSSTTISMGTSHSETSTAGISWGGGGGPSSAGGGSAGASINIGGSYSYGTTDGTSFTVGMSSYTKELAIKKDTKGNKVTWTYTGTMPRFYVDDYYRHEMVAAILRSDGDLTNEICWSVDNPVGVYTVNIESTPQTAALLFKNDESMNPPRKYEYTDTPTAEYSHTLLEPNRALQSWRMLITIDEWEGAPVTGAQAELESAMRNGFPDVFASAFKLGDKSKTSLEAINYVITASKEKFTKNISALQAYAKSWGIKQFSIHWSCDDNEIKYKPVPFVVKKPEDPKPVAQAVWCEGNTTLYFINNITTLKAGDTWDGQTVSRVWSGTNVTNTLSTKAPRWNGLGDAVSRVVFDKSFAEARPTSTCAWFEGFSKLTTIEGIENLNTSEVTTMKFMFQNCSSLTTINVDGFDMSKVGTVSYMFKNCTSLTTIYCSQTWDIALMNYMFSNCTSLKGAADFNWNYLHGSMANPRTGYFTLPQDITVTNIYLKDASSNTSLLEQYKGKWVNARYSRTLTAKDGKATPWTVCLPYELDLSAAVSKGQTEIYTLAAVENGLLVFKKLNISKLTAGTPYVVMVKSGTIGLSATTVQITASVPTSTKVYDSVANWEKGSGTVIGEWMGTFDVMDADMAAAYDAFALQSGDLTWVCYDPESDATIPAFRAFLSSSRIDMTAHQARYE